MQNLLYMVFIKYTASWQREEGMPGEELYSLIGFYFASL
jgi:hypothetical protein